MVEKLGCKSTILVKPDGNHSDLRKQAQNATGGLGADASIIVTDSHATIAVASAVTRRHGNVVLVGCVNYFAFFYSFLLRNEFRD